MTKKRSRKPGAVKWSEKVERFCAWYVRTGNASESYRRSHPTSRAKDATVNVEASRLLADPKVTLRIQDLRARLAEASGVTLTNHLVRLDRAYWHALRKGQVSAAVSAEKARGEVVGLYEPRSRLQDPPPAPEPSAPEPSDDEVARSLLVLMRTEKDRKRKEIVS